MDFSVCAGESLTQRLQEANVSFGELVESEPQLIVLGSGRGLRLSTRQHLEEFDLLQPSAAAAAPTAAAAVSTGLKPISFDNCLERGVSFEAE